jgi:hypothetical protein
VTLPLLFTGLEETGELWYPSVQIAATATVYSKKDFYIWFAQQTSWFQTLFSFHPVLFICLNTRSKIQKIHVFKAPDEIKTVPSWSDVLPNIQQADAMQRQTAENLKQIFPEKEYRDLSPNFHIHVSEATQFPEKEYINGFAIAVRAAAWATPHPVREPRRTRR